MDEQSGTEEPSGAGSGVAVSGAGGDVSSGASSGASSGGGIPSGVVTARGTSDGLIVRLDARVDPSQLEQALREFLSSRSGFLKGNGVFVEWLGKKPAQDLVTRINQMMRDDFEIEVRPFEVEHDITLAGDQKDGQPAGHLENREKSSGRGRMSGRDATTPADPPHDGSTSLSLFDGIMDGIAADEPASIPVGGEAPLGSLDRPLGRDGVAPIGDSVSAGAALDSELYDDADARVVHGTLRSGQRIETEHSLVVCGDVNSGAEIVAGGDLFVLGTLRGVAHAGAYDETGGGRYIFALDLRPTQLRIGTVISRGSAEKSGVPEIARVDGNLIVVEPYLSRSAAMRKRF